MAEPTATVSTTTGAVRGVAGDGVGRWRSIPYARPPVGELRLRAPQPAKPWRGVRHCHEFAWCAPQDPRFTRLGLSRHQPMSEDCLTLNVVAPEGPVDEPLPVMFFIHGGGYLFGSSATGIYDGSALARRGCVFVSANYRLGALGCIDLSSLATDEHPIDGNLFLRDLVLALEWVRDNIAGFGGDPGNVTIFGESAGGHAVAMLLGVPAAEGLFHRAISESPPTGMIRTADDAAETAGRLAAHLDDDIRRAAGVLRSARPSQIARATERVMRDIMTNSPGSFGIGPAVDGSYLPVNPVAAMAQGGAHPVPLIIGNNADEGRLFARFLDHLPTNERRIEKLLANMEATAGQQIRAAYPGYPDPAACLTLGGDFAFASMAWQIAEAHSRHAPTYLYRYDYSPRTLSWAGIGASHATELLAVFDVYDTALGSMLTLAGDRRSARTVSRDVQRRWRAFSRTGVPGGDWPRYAEPDRSVLVFDRAARVERDPMPMRRRAWQHHTLAR